tara:strand:+ start:474 stop:1919 length:1446 start_codon:yes stop_codon:yes gene_type:complete
MFLDDLLRWVHTRDASGFVAAFLLGNTKSIDIAFKNSLKFVGAYHVLVVSGYHMMLMRKWLVTVPFIRGRYLAISQFIFFVISGMGIPCARAWVSGLIFLPQSSHRIEKLAIVWASLLLLYPTKCYSQSMLLSMLAGSYLSIGHSIMRDNKNKDIVLDVGVSLVLLPLLRLYGMNQSSWAWLIGTIVTPFVIYLALLHCIVIVFDTLIGLNLSTYISIIDQLFIDFVIKLDEIIVDRGIMQWPIAVCLFFALMSVTLWIKGFYTNICMFVFLCLWGLCQWDTYTSYFQCFEVGHGLSCLWYQGSNAILYDTARRGYGGVIRQYLDENHIKLDTIIISHSDIDHAGGVWHLLGSLKRSGVVYGSPLTSVCRGKKKNHCLDVVCVSAGFKRCYGKLCWEVIHPKYHFRTQNQMSLVVRLKGRKTILLTGDIDERVLRFVEKDGMDDWFSDLWLEPHHGRTGLNDRQSSKMGIQRIQIGKEYVF